MVAEAVREETVAVEETQVPQPEVEAPPSPPAPEETAEDTSEPNLDAAHEEFMRSLGATEDVTPGTEPDAKPLSPEAQAEVDRVLSEQQKTNERLQRETGVINGLRDWATKTRADAAAAGVAPNVTDWFIQKGIEAMNLKTQVTQIEASEAAAVETVNGFYDAMAKELPASKRQAFLNARGTEHKSQPDTVKAFISMAREGYVPAKDVVKAKAEAVEAYKAHLIAKKLLKGHDAPPSEGGGGTGRNAASDDAILSDPNSPRESKFAAYQRKHGSRHPLDTGGK